MSDRAKELMPVIRASKAFGKGSCSTVDECLDDPELLANLQQSLHAGETPVQIIEFMVDVEQAFWEREGLFKWEKDHAAAIRELKEEVAKL